MDNRVALTERSGEDDPRLLAGQPPSPPPPPLGAKRWALYRIQLVGIPLIMLIMVAALFGVFGDKTATVSRSNGTLEVTVEVVERFRFKMIGPLRITVSNLSGSPVSGLTVRIDRQYLSRFSNLAFIPAPDPVTAQWYVFELGGLAEGEAVAIDGEIQSESFGSHTGTVEVTSDSGTLTIPIDTLSFP